MSQSAARIIESWKNEDLNESAANSPAGHIRLVSSAGELRRQGDEVQANSASCYTTDCYTTDCYTTACYTTDCYTTACYTTQCSTVLTDCG